MIINLSFSLSYDDEAFLISGGYGWVVVFASFLANLIVDGIIFTVGDTLLSLWQKDFGTSDTASALTLSILSGSYLLVGPIASALANMYGCRAIVITGSFLAFFGFICSTIAPQITFLYFSFGLVGGIGFGLIYLPSIVIIAQYFAENRSLATGLAVCGSGIGTTVFSTINPIVMSFLGENWRLFLVYLAGCSLICTISAIIYVSMEPSTEQIEKIEQSNSEYVAQGVVIERLAKPKPRFDPDRPFLSTIELNAMCQQFLLSKNMMLFGVEGVQFLIYCTMNVQIYVAHKA
ncbi:hypothetical protein DICVIV_13651 [Dictyocaulus viviparus]|uniref:Major facilitator superfamily (MFS) profile domain-containing protein n=1 Tax=Dictyocaulus viviparus TaxID=29172 RepID=A0A0D8XD99_DICVI|nr:hypothetical protein DICVIV_13651 [Dictyocaulus viviparus]